MSIWRFLDYVEPGSGRAPYWEWESGLPDDVQAFIDVRILAMAAMLRWPEKWASKYQGTDKIIELRCTHKKVQYRPLGAYQPNRVFVLLGGGVEKDDQIPRGIIQAVVQRQQTLEAHPTYVRRHRFHQG